jgi:hypothetical protein
MDGGRRGLTVHEATARRVAIKVLLPEYARDSKMTARFFNEARVRWDGGVGVFHLR